MRPSPVLPPPSTQAFPAPSYVVSGRRRAHEAQWERQESERAAQVRDGKATPPAPSGDLAPRWRNAVSWYEVRGSAQALEIVLVETCAMADCSRKTFPNRPVFRGRVEGDWLLGVVLIRAAIESRQDETPCPSLAGEFPVKGRISGDHRWISWKPAEFPTRLGCSASTLSLGTWRREP
ncbi:MAG: hypothetical protein IH606_12235 [Burkholderiales bacterium]|nr:hypothetical protein [Burkholderiales bacterium]